MIISETIRLLQLYDYNKQGRVIEIAKGKYETITFKNVFNKIRIPNSRTRNSVAKLLFCRDNS